MYQTCTVLGHVTKCSIVSSCSLHIGHIGSTLMFLLIKLSFVGNASLHAFQIKCFIFGGMFNYHIFFLGVISLWIVILETIISSCLVHLVIILVVVSFCSFYGTWVESCCLGNFFLVVFICFCIILCDIILHCLSVISWFHCVFPTFFMFPYYSIFPVSITNEFFLSR